MGTGRDSLTNENWQRHSVVVLLIVPGVTETSFAEPMVILADRCNRRNGGDDVDLVDYEVFRMPRGWDLVVLV